MNKMYNNLINFSFKKILLLSSIAFGCFVSAQTPALEFAAGAGNPAGNGPTIANQVITFQNNTNNPAGNTFAAFTTPTTTVTFSLTNQQRTMTPSPGVGVMFGGSSTNASATPVAAQLFSLMNGIGSPSDNQFTSANSTAGTGISVANNRAIWIYASVYSLYEANAPLPTAANPKVRYQYADLVATFSRPITNPIFHFGGCGTGITGSGGNSYLNSAELELLTSGASLTRLSGSTEFTVPSATSIINGASQYSATTGSGAMSGSVRVNGTNLTQVSFRIYISAMDNSSIAADTTSWNLSNGAASNFGDAFSVGVSITPSNPCNAGTTAPSLSATTLSNTCPAYTANLNSLHTGTVPSGASLVWFTNNTHSGSVYTTPTAATAGTYYAYYYDSTNDCYSPVSSAVTVTITPCCAAGTTGPAIN